jgi:uncharacterized protein (TIGR00255 family)
MIRSMTGFGKASGSFEGQEISVELSGVNHRYLDASVRLPYAWAALEPDIKQVLRQRVSRGKIGVTVNRKRLTGASQRIQLDKDTATQYMEASRELAAMLGTADTLSLNVLAQMEGVFITEEPEESFDALREAVLGILDEATGRMNAMRETEGAALAEEIRGRLDGFRKTLAGIEARLPELNGLYEERLRTRIAEFQADLALTEERIALEVALLAEKADVTEEVVRLKTHLDHMAEMLGAKEPVGRKLDFLLQELQREINTLGVKTRDSDVARDVLFMKAELEKIREQAQNIE